MESFHDQIRVFAGNSNPPLVRDICRDLDMPLGEALVETFSDGEIRVEIKENVRGCDVFVIQSTCAPGNENLMELLLMLDAFRRASAKRVTAVIPYYGYARQDRKVAPRVPISAKLVADLITTAGASRMLTMDLHSGQIQGFFNIPVDNLYASPVLLQYMESRIGTEELIVVSPDAGGAQRARAFATKLNVAMAVIDKRRADANVVEEMNIIGEVEGKVTILIDDMVDTAGTIAMAAEALVLAGAKKVIGCCTHAVLSGKALDRINDAPMEEMVVTDTIPLSAKMAKCEKITPLSVAPLIGEAIRRTHLERSISSLF